MKPPEIAILKNTITKEEYRNLLSDLQTNSMIVEFIGSITEYCVKKSLGEPGNLTNWVLIQDHERLDIENQKMKKIIDAVREWVKSGYDESLRISLDEYDGLLLPPNRRKEK